MADRLAVDKAYLIDTLKTMVSIDSILPHEERLAEFIADELRAMGVEPEWQEVAPGRPREHPYHRFRS
ncbi:MAG: hypothetical protein E3J21_09420 [Anaerolineales bacterium]|nr:MAG: hypothetical protein E3J21_09420 [Anaerolineales bacterium]